METEYIEKQAAIDALHEAYEARNPTQNAIMDKATMIVFHLQPADVRPVVFCKDCKHREYMDNRIPTERDWVCCMFDITTKETDFCSFGREKGGDAE